jgi:CDP-diacylglycerol--glycerol-3-phosphate 3-phosphatidyltransferase
MTLSLADRLTVSRLVLAPCIVLAYLALPLGACFWVAGSLCALAEITDLLDGRVARARGETSDFGKLADPFCDVFYRMAVFLVLLLPASGVGYPPPSLPIGHASLVRPLVYAVGMRDGLPHLGCGLAPWLPVALMVLREIVAMALRALAAASGLILAARASGKVKAWCQGFALITMLALPALTGGCAAWHLVYDTLAVWACAVLSIASIIEYLAVNRAALRVMTRVVKQPSTAA